MDGTAGQILKTYIALTLLTTFAASFIWGINTLFLLDAGLTVTQAFAANAFFTGGQVLFEVPTGLVADTLGRRFSYLSGSATLFVATLLYLLLWRIGGPFWTWAVVSMLLGLGFTFFSGATEAWLVDGLAATNYEGTLESVFAKGEVAGGIAMLAGTLTGGVVAQATNLGVPYLLRAAILAVTFVVAFVAMRDVGFTPRSRGSAIRETRAVLGASLRYGLKNRPVRWLMVAGPFVTGVGFFAFYAMQPYLLELYGRSDAYAVSGLAAAVVAGAEIAGGLLVPSVRRLFRSRTGLLLVATLTGAVALLLIGVVPHFPVALGLLALWGIVDAVSYPVRLAFLNGLIPTRERATIISSDNLFSSSGGVLFQPALGRVADLWGYGASYVAGAAITLLALPFILRARREQAPSDLIEPRGR